MPKKYMCNACKAVVWHLDKGFSDATHGGKKVPPSSIMEEDA